MDVIIFGGQSNMMGQTGSMPTPNLPVKNAFEYKYMANEIVPLVHPVGETIGEWLHGAEKGGGGSLVPFFCDAYVRLTKKRCLPCMRLTQTPPLANGFTARKITPLHKRKYPPR